MCGLKYRAALHPVCRIEPEASDLLAQPGHHANGSFFVHNDGEVDLHFKVTPSCQCTKIDPKSGTVAPGKSEIVRVEISPLMDLGAVRPVSIQIQTNDPKEPSQQVGFTVAKSIPWEGVTGNVSFGVLTKRNYAGQTRSLELSSSKSGPPAADNYRDSGLRDRQCRSHRARWPDRKSVV